MAFAAYVICATPRSGSTMLCHLLSQSGAGQPHSYFREEDIGYWADRWGVPHAADETDPAFNRAHLAGMTRAGRSESNVFGLRLMWDSVPHASLRLDAALGGSGDILSQMEQAFDPTLFIQLSRADKAAQAASLLRAERTGLWHLNADGSQRERGAPTRTTVDDRSLARARDNLTQADAAWSRLFDRREVVPLRLTYEALSGDPPLRRFSPP